MFIVRAIVFVVWIISSLIWASDLTGNKIVYGVRVAFEPDDSPGTTGDGTFLINTDFDTCGRYTLDPPPHDRNYFLSHYQAIDHYFRSVSYNKLGLDMDQSEVFPISNNTVYVLPHSMSYYNPYNEPEVQDARPG